MPERIDGWWWDGSQYRRVDPHDEEMSLDTVRCLLKLAGLSICTEAERKVLEEAIACFRCPEREYGAKVTTLHESIKAELARRGQP
jgi:hypothetical protein